MKQSDSSDSLDSTRQKEMRIMLEHEVGGIDHVPSFPLQYCRSHELEQESSETLSAEFREPKSGLDPRFYRDSPYCGRRDLGRVRQSVCLCAYLSRRYFVKRCYGKNPLV
jgi:hypothetical protein